MPKYVAFLRGINLGRRSIKMDALRKFLKAAGYENVLTLLASGNVIFEKESKSLPKIKAALEKQLKDEVGFDVPVILRSAKDIKALVASQPFNRIRVSKQNRLYVTFLLGPPKNIMKTPYKSGDGQLTILQVTNSHIASVLEISSKSGTTDYMDFLGKEFGKGITTRNWNTVMKVYSLMQE
ncbi:MAG: DUF1697 domain-containing protein [Anaerolineales bacterium]